MIKRRTNQLAFARAGSWGIASAVQRAHGKEIQPQMLFLSVLICHGWSREESTHMYIHRHPARPWTSFSPAYTAAIKKPEKRGPTEVKTWMMVFRRASSWGL
jgi:hypothetical protein